MTGLVLARGAWRAEIWPESGGNLVRLLYDGVDVLRPPPDRRALSASPTEYGIPVLFPPNRIDGGGFLFSGEFHALPLNEPERGNHLHGLALRAPWRVLADGDDFAEMLFRFGPDAREYSG